MTKKILWMSRHQPHHRQVEALCDMYGKDAAEYLFARILVRINEDTRLLYEGQIFRIGVDASLEFGHGRYANAWIRLGREKIRCLAGS